ncbi:MAG TPA: hypothetical protein ENJ20_00685 [Bacteroidetes bacterium]|nr:hypothetical protein [Bacteroidota bacterium]
MPDKSTPFPSGQPLPLDDHVLLPETLKAYKEIDPELPQKIFTFLKERKELELKQTELQYQHLVQKKLVSHKIIQGYLSIFAGLIAAMSVLYLGFIFLQNKHATEGAGIVIAVTIGLAGVFVLRKYNPKAGHKDQPEHKAP